MIRPAPANRRASGMAMARSGAARAPMCGSPALPRARSTTAAAPASPVREHVARPPALRWFACLADRAARHPPGILTWLAPPRADRKHGVEGKEVSIRVDLRGGTSIKKKKKDKHK